MSKIEFGGPGLQGKQHTWYISTVTGKQVRAEIGHIADVEDVGPEIAERFVTRGLASYCDASGPTVTVEPDDDMDLT